MGDIFIGDQSGSGTTTYTPGAWDPQMEQLWNQWFDEFTTNYEANAKEDADYKNGVDDTYQSNMTAAQDKYTTAPFSLSAGGNTVYLTPNSNVNMLNTLGTQYDTQRDNSLETTPNQGWFDYMNTLGETAWKGQDYRYQNQDVTETGEVNRDPSTIEEVGNWVDLGTSAFDIIKSIPGASSLLNLGSSGGTTAAGASTIGSPGTSALSGTMGSDAASLAAAQGGTGLSSLGTSGAMGMGSDAASLAAAEAAAGSGSGLASTGVGLTGASTALWAVPVAQALYGANIIRMHNENEPNRMAATDILRAAEGETTTGDGHTMKIVEQDGKKYLYDEAATKRYGQDVWYDIGDEDFLETVRSWAVSDVGVSQANRSSDNRFLTGGQNDAWKSTIDTLNPTGMSSNEIEDLVTGTYKNWQAPKDLGLG